MLLIERHLTRQFAESVFAVAVVLLLVTLGALFADLISEIAKGKIPAGLLLSQLGLRSVRFITLVMPLALFLGLLIAISRMYAESEMAVLASVGLGPQRLWKPLLLVSAPIVLVVGLASLWLAPLSAQRAKDMIEEANRSFLIAGLEPGRFVELPGKAGVLYVTELTPDGTHFQQLFVQRENAGRLDTELDRLRRIPLLVCDEVGYIPFEPEAAALFYALVAAGEVSKSKVQRQVAAK